MGSELEERTSYRLAQRPSLRKNNGYPLFLLTGNIYIKKLRYVNIWKYDFLCSTFHHSTVLHD